MAHIEIYTKDWCRYCTSAKALLNTKNVSYEEIDVTRDLGQEAEMVQRSGRRTVPQIFIDERHIGGSDDLASLDARGELNPLLGLPEDDESARRSPRYVGIRTAAIDALRFLAGVSRAA